MIPDVVRIKKYWDFLPHIDVFYKDLDKKEKNSGRHSHILRYKEIQRLEDFVNRREEGSILITGKRGIGKTSIIQSSIINSISKIRQDCDKIVLPVLVDAPSIGLPELGDNKSIISGKILLDIKKSLIQNLVRQLMNQNR